MTVKARQWISAKGGLHSCGIPVVFSGLFGSERSSAW